jgi:hypothetical protein
MLSSSFTRDNTISSNELRQNLQKIIKNSGVLNEVKAHIRMDIILSISRQSIHSASKIKLDFHSRVVQSIIYQYLQTNSLLKTLSVFEAEFGIESRNNILSGSEITDALRLKYLDSDEGNNADESLLDKIVRSLEYDSAENYLSTSIRKEKDLSLSTIHKKDDHTGTLKSQLRSEKALSSALTFKCEELQKLVEDQQRTILALSGESNFETRKSFSRKLLETHG